MSIVWIEYKALFGKPPAWVRIEQLDGVIVQTPVEAGATYREALEGAYEPTRR